MASGKNAAAAQGAWLCFEDEAAQTLRPPKARTWARRGQTPVVAVSGKGSGRVSVAGLVCVKEGHRSRLFYRMRVYRGRKGERCAFTEEEFVALLCGAHQRLGAPIVVIWDNANTHISTAMTKLVDRYDWLTVVRLPAYAPELNPAEGVWSNLKGGLGNFVARSLDQLAATVKILLKRIQYQHGLIDGFVAETGLLPKAQPP